MTSDIHCVTRWSRFDNAWEGVAVREILAARASGRPPSPSWPTREGGYTTNLPWRTCCGRRAARVRHDGRDLPPEHGGPCRLVVPQLYFWKSAKWVRAFEVMDVNAPGFWEGNGYHMRADPLREERFSDQETDAMQRMRADAARARDRARGGA